MFGLVGRVWRLLFPRPPAAGFRLHDGRRWRLADPLTVQDEFDRLTGGKWVAMYGEWLDLCRLARSPALKAWPPEQVAAHKARTNALRRELADLTGKAFGVAPLEAGGLSQEQRLGLFVDFVEHLGEVAERHRPLPGTSPATGPAG